MGRKKASGTSRKISSSVRNSKKHKATKSPLNSSGIEELLKQADSFLNDFDYEGVKNCCRMVISKDADNVKAMEMLASILMDETDFEQAQNLYLRCVELKPNEGYEKYFSLAQINSGKKSLEFYHQGISVIKKILEKSENMPASKDFSQSLKRAMSNAYCSIAELYTTDLCDEEDAEELCKKAMKEGNEADPENPDVYHCIANYHLIKSEKEDAKSAIKKNLALWLPYHELLRDKAEVEPELQVTIPEYDSRIKTGQILIELEMFEEATKVLDGLLDENDEDFFVWFLLGWSNYIHGDEYKGNAHFYFQKAKEASKKHGGNNEDLMKQTDELIEELKDYAAEECDKENAEPLNISSDDENECDVDMEL